MLSEENKPKELDIELIYPTLKNYAFYLTNKVTEEAEDLLHDTVLRILEKREQFINADKTTLRRWGVSIMHNLFIDKIRVAQKLNKIFLPNIYNLETHLDNEVSYDIRVRKTMRSVKTILRSHPQLKRMEVLFILRGLGLSYKEISKHMDVSTSSVKNIMFEMKSTVHSLSRIKNVSYVY